MRSTKDRSNKQLRGKFCIPIMGRDMAEIMAKIDKAAPKADVLELRIDLMDSFDLEKLIRYSKKPPLVTYRSRSQGGKGLNDPGICARYIHEALRFGAQFVDVELTLPRDFIDTVLKKRSGSSIILSMHITDHTPQFKELKEIFMKQVDTGADIIKLVTFANSYEDNLSVFELLALAIDMDIDIITFCMGQFGKISRITAHLMGGFMTFASLEDDEHSAPGQISIDKMKQILDNFLP